MGKNTNCIVKDIIDFFFFKQKTAYEIGTGDWSSDVCLPISYIKGLRVAKLLPDCTIVASGL